MARSSARNRQSWEHLSDEDLLGVRISDLRVRIEGSELPPRIRQLYAELEAKGLGLRPLCFLSDEWLSPGDQVAIGIPFYLAHPRLKALENRMMFEVEGGTPVSCMKLLRHEAGHAVDHAYRLSRNEDWQEIFGSPRRRYQPYLYESDRQSRRFVRSLPDHYAQAHPVEDFAETFAVWLNPNSRWRERYAGWPALKKLRYVDRLMRELRGRRPPRRRPVPERVARSIDMTLRRYYQRKFRLYGLGDLTFAVRDMRTIFRVSKAAAPDGLASDFIRAHKRKLVDSIASWSGESRSQVARVVATLARLADDNRLVVRGDADKALVAFSTFATTLAVSKLLNHSYRLTRP